MYEQAFNFSQRPFSVCPQTEEYFPGQSHQQAITASGNCVQRRNGPATIIGAVGTGKSLTMQVIGETYADQFDVVSIECSRLEQRSELLQSILFGMDLPFRDLGEGELRLSLIDHLKNGSGNENGILLLVDEADRLSIELLDELRLITNVVRDGRSQVQLVLAGTQRLEESLNDPRLASFSQRVASRSYLQNFSRDEVSEYIADQIQRVGRESSDVFEEEAVAEVARNSDGCPRVINQLCERSFALAADQELPKVTQNVVQHAWAELQNLPVPRSSVATVVDDGLSGGDSSESVLEFGSLDDDQGSVSFSSNFGDQQYEDDSQQQEAECSDSEAECCDSEAKCDDSEDDQEEACENETCVDAEAQEDEQSSVVAEENSVSPAEVDGPVSEDPEQWSGQLPTNLGVTTYRAFDAGSMGFAVPPYGSGGDPFAPEEAAPPTQTFKSGTSVDEGVAAEDAIEDPVENHVEDRIEALEQEQQDLLEQVHTDTTSFDSQNFQEPSSESDVENAFQGLDQIDQARSAEVAPTQFSGPPSAAADPFEEEFEDEVLLQEAYTPFVAKQNQSSLSVTSEQLSHLTPNDEVKTAETEVDSLASFRVSADTETTDFVPVQSVATELSFPEDSLPEDPKESAEEIDPDLAALTGDFSFDEDAPSIDQAGTFHDVAESSEEVVGVNEEANAQPSSNDSESELQAIQYSQDPPLDDSQKVLREILAQQQIVQEARHGGGGADSTSVEYPITEHDNYREPSKVENDDRDILRVNESHYAQTPVQEPAEPTPFADAKPSTGEAQRMDYGQLFDQLRNMPKE